MLFLSCLPGSPTLRLRTGRTAGSRLTRFVARKILDVSLLFLLFEPLLEFGRLLLLGELLFYLRLDLLERGGFLCLYLIHLDNVIPELRLHGADYLSLFGAEKGFLEGRREGPLWLTTEVSTLVLAARVLRILFGELGEISTVFELPFHLFSLLLLVFLEQDVAGAALLGGGELEVFVLVVVSLYVFLGRLGVAGNLLLNLLQRELFFNIRPELLLRKARLF